MTTLTFALDPLPAAIVALLKSPTNLNVHVGTVKDADASTKTISAPTPYVRINGGLGWAPSARVGGRSGKATRFRIGYVGITEDQCRAVAQAVRGLMNGAKVSADGRNYTIRLDESDDVSVSVDQEWTRPDGSPLFYAIDDYVAR